MRDRHRPLDSFLDNVQLLVELFEALAIAQFRRGMRPKQLDRKVGTGEAR